jgi:diguanylate cyclase (GGDEF)-like protein/PAS domain S-box-containing protein
MSRLALGSICASITVGVIETRYQLGWGSLVLAAVPVYFTVRLYAVLLSRRNSERRHRDVAALLDQPFSAIDSSGRVTQWNDPLARLVGCPREQAMGQPLAQIMRTRAGDEFQRAVDDALTNGRSHKLKLRLTPGDRAVTLEINILPDDDGAMLIWRDGAEQGLAEHTLKQSAERLAALMEGANDGLWIWDRRQREFYLSSRWRALLGMPAQSGIGRREDWLDRVHPDDVGKLKESLDAHLSGQTAQWLHEYRIRHEDGTYRWFLGRGVASSGADGRSDLIAGSLTSVAEQTTARGRTTRGTAGDDALTGLCNRAVFVEKVGERLTKLKRLQAGRFAVLYLDLDRFKVINDSLGHLVGDELLIAVSRRLESCVRDTDVLARLGGDEFAILVASVGDDMQANVLALRIQDALSAPFSIGGREVFTSVSIGIACSRVEHTNPEQILRDADTAMYHAKASGKARHELFDADMHARSVDRLELEGDLRQAVKSQTFEMHYQPIVLLESSMCVGFEALVRWTRNGTPVSPADFVPVAEELGLMESLGGWVLQESCRRFTQWRRQYPAAALEYITVNVSARQLMQQGFVRFVEETVLETGIRPCDLRLEITETALMHNPREAAQLLHSLRDFGVKIYLDDFGTGYSSLSHLHKLPVDALKIDRSFVRSMLLTDGPAIVESILALARTLETGVVAEGVETEQQARELARLGCRYAQGYFFSRPLPVRSAEEILAANCELGRPQVQRSNQRLAGIA